MSKVNKTITFGGLDNQHTPTQVGVDNLVIAANVDLMDDRSIQRRGGTAASSVTGVGLHSLWAVLDETLGFVIDQTTLYQLDGTLGKTQIGSMPSAAEACYVEINDIVAIVTVDALRFVNASAFLTPVIQAPIDGEHQFKRLMIDLGGGNCCEFINGRLLVGTDTGINFSDHAVIGQYDKRDFFLPIPFPVTALAAVDNGLWVCGPNNIAFLPGDTIKTMVYKDSIDSGVVALARTRRGEWKGNDRVAPEFAILTGDGVFILGESGSMTQISENKYKPPVSTGMASIVRDINGAKQFLSSFNYVGDRHIFKEKTITMDIEEG